MESDLVMAFRHIAANDNSFALKVLADFGKFVNEVTERDIIERLDSEAIAALQKYASEIRRRNNVSKRGIKRKGGRP